MAATAASLLTLSGVAVADNIGNRLDTSIDAVAEIMPLNVGGPNGSTKLYVDNTNGDGKNGCNLTGDTKLVVSVESSNPAVATVSPASAEFTSCGSEPTLTIHAVSAGTTTVRVSQTSNDTGGTFNLAPATFDVNVTAPAPANTAPVVTVDGVDQGAEYSKGAVPAATCKVTDAEDGNKSFAAALSTDGLDADGLGSQTASCSFTDGGGLTASASESYRIMDKSAPVIGYTVSPTGPDGTNGWYTGTVTVDWTVTESDSPNSLTTDGCADVTVSADQLGTSYTCSAKSSGGVSSVTTTESIKRDGNGPSVSYTSAAGTLGNGGWYVSPVTATFTATDGFSGPATQTGTTPSGSQQGAAVFLGSPEFSDDAGNTTQVGAASSPAFMIDTVAPAVGVAVLSGTPNAAGWYRTPVTASFTGTDATSGIVGVNPKVVPTGTDQGELTLQSPEFQDVAGNTTPAGVKQAVVKVDTVAPSVALVDGPAEDESYYFGSVPASPTCTASDATSGVAGACSISGFDQTVGTHTVVATATDRAGNVSTAQRTYTVLAWTTKGFYSPVDMGGALNIIKGGSTVPLKFEMFAGSTELTSPSDILSFTTAKVSCAALAGAVTDEIEVLSTGGTSLRYDTTGGQFVQNWKTPTGAGVCYKATMTAQDGSTVVAYFKTR